MQTRPLRAHKAALLIALTISSAQAIGCPAEPYLGTVCFTANTFCPKPAYLEANGGTLKVSDNPALYSLLGIKYGGTIDKDFKLPDLRGRVPVGAGQGIGLIVRKLGEMYGQETVALTDAALPAHSHSMIVTAKINEIQAAIPVSPSMGDVPSPQSGAVYPAASSSGAAFYTSSAPVDAAASISAIIPGASVTIEGETYSSGAGAAFAVSQPSLVLRACIAVSGVYPPRN